MKSSKFRRTLIATSLCLAAGQIQAETVNLQQAVELSLAADPRIKESEQLIEAARGLLQEAQGHNGLRIKVNAFVGLAPEVSGGFYQGGATSGVTPRSDGNANNGVSDWTSLEFSIIKPLYTFGKVERYSEAAQGNIEIKQGDLGKTKADTVYETKRAYFGYLTARDLRVFLEDMKSRLGLSIGSVEKALKDETGEARQSDLYSLQSARALIGKYVLQARAVEKISLDGLKVLTGVGLNADLQVSDDRLEAVPFPLTQLAELQARSLQVRPEMQQLEAGLRSRRALVAAKKADRMPDIYAGVVGLANYASNRDSLDNPHVFDPFNNYGITPVVGVRWDNVFAVEDAKVNQAQAELEALNHKKAFALLGIPYEVSEAYANAQANYASQKELAEGSAAARHWMVATLADYSAGLEGGDKVAEAARNYALTQTEYLRTINDYNMNIAQLVRLSGDFK
jgi:outer membrane protein